MLWAAAWIITGFIIGRVISVKYYVHNKDLPWEQHQARCDKYIYKGDKKCDLYCNSQVGIVWLIAISPIFWPFILLAGFLFAERLPRIVKPRRGDLAERLRINNDKVAKDLDKMYKDLGL
jgi:hypothetical protein